MTECKLYDEVLFKQILPRLKRIKNPKDRINAIEPAYRRFRKDFPNVVGVTKYFAQIEVDTRNELDLNGESVAQSAT